ncbi:MAG: fumarylacetoacetate hydrolase family protein [Burkholderiales bacterium]
MTAIHTLNMQLDAIIELVWEHLQRGDFYPAGLHGKLSLDDAYRVNLAVTRRRIAAGERQAGWKVGVTAKAMQQQMGVHQPVFGVLFDSGHLDSAVTLKFADLIEPSVENELCITIGQTLRGPGVTLEQTRAAIAAVAPALEIVERRGEFKDLPLAMADNAQQKHFVTATQSAWEPIPKRGQVSMRLSEAYVEVFLNSVLQEKASGAEVMGDPVASVTWLANKLAEYDLTLEGGMCVMSGSFTKQYRIKPGDHIEARFTPFGVVSANFL